MEEKVKARNYFLSTVPNISPIVDKYSVPVKKTNHRMVCCFIISKKLSTTFLIKNQSYFSNSKRFYPGGNKPIGPIIENLSKPKPPISATPAITPSPSNLKPSSTNNSLNSSPQASNTPSKTLLFNSSNNLEVTSLKDKYQNIPPGMYTPKTGTIYPNNNYTSQTTLVTQIESNINTRPYATYSLNYPDKNNKDPQALNNNPFLTLKNGKKIKHKEIIRQTCDKPGCIGKFCVGLCGMPKGVPKAIAHTTHGQSSPAEVDKKTVTVSQIDFNGDPKQQNAVFYDNPHASTNAVPDPKATQRINSDTQIQNAIKTYEND